MSLICLRTNYRCLWTVTLPTTDISMTCLHNSYRYVWSVPVPTTDVYDLSPYQLQVCLRPVSVTATDTSMSLICPRTNHTTRLVQWPITHCQTPQNNIYVRPPCSYCITPITTAYCFKSDYYRPLQRFKIRYATGVHASLVRRSAILSLLIERN
jgi:hypothetical protein